MDNTIQIENESSAINTGQQIRNNIVNVTRKLNHGKECDICDDGELEFDINRTKSKDNYTARVKHITNKVNMVYF